MRHKNSGRKFDRNTSSRRALSAGDRSFCGVYATAPRRHAFVIKRSATRRSSLALASVVSIFS